MIILFRLIEDLFNVKNAGNKATNTVKNSIDVMKLMFTEEIMIYTVMEEQCFVKNKFSTR